MKRLNLNLQLLILICIFGCKTSTALKNNNKLVKPTVSIDYIEESKGNVIPYLRFENGGSGHFSYTICKPASSVCANDMSVGNFEPIYGLSSGNYLLSSQYCDDKTCRPLEEDLALIQSPFANAKSEELYSIQAELKLYAETVADEFHDIIQKQKNDILNCELKATPAVVAKNSENYKHYKDRIGLLARSNKNILTKQLISGFEPVILGRSTKASQLSLAGKEGKKWKLMMYNFQYKQAKAIVGRKNGAWFFDKEGLKQQILGGRYGHSALSVGEIDATGVVEEGGAYISWPRGDDFNDDVARYKAYRSEIIGYIDDTQKARLEVWLKKSNVSLKEEARIYEIYDEIDEIAEALAEKLGPPWDGLTLKAFLKEYPESYKKELLEFCDANQKLKKQKVVVSDLLDQYESMRPELAELEKPLDPAVKKTLEAQRLIVVDSLRSSLGFEKDYDVETFVQKNWEGLNAFENSPNFGHKKAAELEDAFDLALEKLEKIDSELYRPRERYGKSYNQNSFNCSHVSGMCANVALGEETFYRKKVFPADPFDNMKRANEYAVSHADPKERNYKEIFDNKTSTARYVIGAVAAAGILAAASYFTYEELKLSDSSPTIDTSKKYSSCMALSAENFERTASKIINKLDLYQEHIVLVKSLLINPQVTGS